MEDIVRPFITYEALDWLSGWLTPEMTVFEYGSGFSTVWFAQRCSKVVAVESVPDFYSKIRDKLDAHGLDNVEYFLKEEAEDYASLIHEYADPFDLVFVDGRFRKECMEQCYSKAKRAIYLDNTNAEHYQDAFDIMKGYSGGEITTFYGRIFNPYTGQDQPNDSQGSVFIKDTVWTE